MAAEAELLVGHRSRAFVGRMWRGEEGHPLQQRLALFWGRVGVDQRLEVLQLQREGADDTEPVPWHTLHGVNECSGGRDVDHEEAWRPFEHALLGQIRIAGHSGANLPPSATREGQRQDAKQHTDGQNG